MRSLSASFAFLALLSASPFAFAGSARGFAVSCRIEDPSTLARMDARMPVTLRIYHTDERLAGGVFRHASDPARRRKYSMGPEHFEFESRWGDDIAFRSLPNGDRRYGFEQTQSGDFSGHCGNEFDGFWDSLTAPLGIKRTYSFELIFDPKDMSRAHFIHRVESVGTGGLSIFRAAAPSVELIEEDLACDLERVGG